ncbi:hypothetical protein VUR80DRAFT_9491 [Thermomyces stellatus]
MEVGNQPIGDKRTYPSSHSRPNWTYTPDEAGITTPPAPISLLSYRPNQILTAPSFALTPRPFSATGSSGKPPSPPPRPSLPSSPVRSPTAQPRAPRTWPPASATGPSPTSNTGVRVCRFWRSRRRGGELRTGEPGKLVARLRWETYWSLLRLGRRRCGCLCVRRSGKPLPFAVDGLWPFFDEGKNWSVEPNLLRDLAISWTAMLSLLIWFALLQMEFCL